MDYYIKKGVSLAGLDMSMRRAIDMARQAMMYHNKPLVITAGTESHGAELVGGYNDDVSDSHAAFHSSRSLHIFGGAIDIRTRFLQEWQKSDVAEHIRKGLGDEYDVLIEKTHIHIEYDPKRPKEQ